MTNNYDKRPEIFISACGNVKADAKYLLSAKNARAALLAGYSIGCALIIVAVLIADAFVLGTPLAGDEYVIMQNILVFFSIWAGVFLLLPGVYCGMYKALLKISAGESVNTSDIFECYMSPKKYFRSVAIFARSNRYFLGIGLMLILFQIAGALSQSAQTDTEQSEAVLSILSIVFSYMIFGTLFHAITRKNMFIFVPYAIENQDVPLKECLKASKGINIRFYSKSLPNDFIKTVMWILLSFMTVGILFAVYVGPMMMSKKVCFYRSSTVNKFN